MTTQTCDPLAARFWFKVREPANWILTGVLFVLLFFVLMQFFGGFVVGLIGIGAVFCLFFFVLDKRAIGIRCSNERCAKHIETNTPWICGNKGCRNDQIDDFPFIFKCQHCGYYPKAYKCHHCEQLIFFTSDHQKDGYAVCANDSFRPRRVKKREQHEDAVVGMKEKIELKGLSLEEAGLDVQLKRQQDALKPFTAKIKTPEQELEEFLNKSVGDEDAAEKWKALVAEKFKDDPHGLERCLLLIDNWVRGRLR